MKHGYLDQYSGLNSFIHRLDPRIKIISFFIFIFFIIFTKPDSIIALGLYGLIILILIASSKIPLDFIFKRSLVIIPFVLMASIFIPLFKKGPLGLMILWNCVIKSYLSVLITIFLMASTGFPDFLKALEKLKCPALMTMILSFMYRYIFVVQDELMKMQQAREARSASGRRWSQTRVLANIIGVLFIRAYEKGEVIYLAMCSRGFNGRVKTVNNFRLKTADFCFLLALVGTLIVIKIRTG